MYFQNFPKIYYDFPSSGQNNDLQILTDITTNVRIRKEILENITIYDEYDILEGETPEMIAEKVYGNAELHWIIMLVNQRYDYLKDFPMSSLELDNYIKEKYGEYNIDDIHHYEKDGLVVDALATLVVPQNMYDACIKGDVIFDPGIKFFAKILKKQENNTISIMIDRGFFSDNYLFLEGVRKNETTGLMQYRLIDSYNIAPNSLTLSPVYEPVTNYLYEVRLNESKRRIKLISPNLINQILSEFESLLNK